MGAAGHDEPRPPLAAPGPSRPGPRRSGGRLRHVHGRLHDAGPRGRRGATEQPGLTSDVLRGREWVARAEKRAPGAGLTGRMRLFGTLVGPVTKLPIPNVLVAEWRKRLGSNGGRVMRRSVL